MQPWNEFGFKNVHLYRAINEKPSILFQTCLIMRRIQSPRTQSAAILNTFAKSKSTFQSFLSQWWGVDVGQSD